VIVFNQISTGQRRRSCNVENRKVWYDYYFKNVHRSLYIFAKKLATVRD